MITHHWGFKVHGVPKPKGSMKCIGGRGKVKHQLVEQVDDGGWRDLVAALAKQHVGEQADPHQPVEVDIWFTLPRPASHFGTGRNRHTVKLGSPVFPSRHGTGDKDKLERLVLDALQSAGVLRDDAQVIRGETVKVYDFPHGGEPAWVRLGDRLGRPGAVVRIRPLGLA